MTRFLAPPERIVAALGTLFPDASETERAAAVNAALALMERAAGGDRVLAIHEGTLEWHAIRAMHVGGSEVAALYDVQRPFAMSHFTLWHVRAGRIAPPIVPDEGRPKWGRILEPAIARAAAEEYGWRIEKGGYVIDATTPGMACSLDYIIAEPGPEEIKRGFTGPGVLQIKNSDWLNHKRQWTGGEPPLWILLQLQHESACTGFGWGYIVCLVGGNELERYGYNTRPRVTDDLRERVTGFWHSIAADKPPKIDGSDSSAAAVARLFPTVKAELPLDLIGDNEMPEICAGYLVAQADRRSAEKHEQEFRNRLVEKLQGNTTAICRGFRLTVAITPAKPPREAKPGEIVQGRAESRRYTVSEDLSR